MGRSPTCKRCKFFIKLNDRCSKKGIKLKTFKKCEFFESIKKEFNFDEVTKLKLKLYKAYLKRYISVLTGAGNNIMIFDLLAGEGKDKKGNEGSVLLTLKTIKEIISTNKGILINVGEPKITLVCNEIKPEKIKRLQQNTNKYIGEIKEGYPNFEFFLFNDNANNIINKLNIIFSSEIINSSNKLFYLDPFGYLTLKNSLETISLMDWYEVFYFLPINFVYRFIATDHKGIQVFKELFNVDLKEKEKVNIIELKDKVVEGFKKIFKTNYVIGLVLMDENDLRDKNAVFFVTHHPKGLEKFLEAIYELGGDTGMGILTTNSHSRLLNESTSEIEFKKYLLEQLLPSNPSNVDILKIGFFDFLLIPKKIKKILDYFKKEKVFELELLNGRGKYYYVSDLKYLNESPKVKFIYNKSN